MSPSPAYVIGVHEYSETDLLEIADARRSPGGRSCTLQCRQQHRREDCDDRNDDEQFDQGEAGSFHVRPILSMWFRKRVILNGEKITELTPHGRWFRKRRT